MRFILFVFLILLPITALSDDIKCYNDGKVIYSADGRDFTYSEGIFVLQEVKTNKIVFIGADCIVKIKVKE